MMEGASENSVKSGWYADPTSRHQYRYWDGSVWTADVADAGQASVDPLDTMAAGSPIVRYEAEAKVQRAGGMSESEKAFLINVAVAIVLPPWILVVVVWWAFFRKRVPLQPQFRRALGIEIMVGAGLYALFALLMVFVSFAAKQPTVAPGTPREVFELAEAGHGFTSGVIVYSAKPYEFRISFEESDVNPDVLNDPDRSKPILESLDGNWSGSSAQLTVNGVRTVDGKPSQHESEWPSSLRDEAAFKARPEMTVALPLTEEDVHRELNVVASMDVGLPYEVDSSHYDVTGVGVSKTAKLFVITEEEMSQRIDRNAAQNRGSIRMVGIVLFALASLVGWRGWRQRRRGLAVG